MLLGWLFDVPFLKDPCPGEAPMAPTSAIAFILCGASIWAAVHNKASAARLLGCTAALVGVMVLSRHIFSWFTFDLDQLLIRYPLAPITKFAPGRMAVNSAIVFIVLGCALATRTKRFYNLVDAGLLIVMMLAVTAFVAHMYGVQQIFTSPLSNQMATPTAILSMTVSLSIALIHKDRGFIAEITTKRVGGWAARRLVPFAVVVPLAAGALTLLGEKAGLFSPNVGTTLVVSMMIIFFSIVIWWTARWLNKSDQVRQQMERESRDYSERTRLIIDRANDAFIRIDYDGTISDWNPAAEKMFGWTKDEILGSSWWEKVVPQKSREVRRIGFEEYLATGESKALDRRFEIWVMRKGGHEFPVEVSVFPVQFGDTKTFCTFVNDISLRKAAEQRISEFVSTVSHELRTPLTSIKGALRLLQGGRAGQLTEKADMLIGIASVQADRLGSLVNDMLDLQKLEAGQLELKMADVDLEELVQKAIVGVQLFADERKIELTHEVLAKGRVCCDQDRIIQVVVNLLSNAIKFSPSESVVKLTVSDSSPQSVRFSVADRGPGVREDQMHKLFGRFQQLDSSDTRAEGGTGLGLAISKSIVEQHGGQIGVDSKAGEGATFWFELPVATASN